MESCVRRRRSRYPQLLALESRMRRPTLVFSFVKAIVVSRYSCRAPPDELTPIKVSEVMLGGNGVVRRRSPRERHDERRGARACA